MGHKNVFNLQIILVYLFVLPCISHHTLPANYIFKKLYLQSIC